jgi:two-component system cell cycle sensor histidine kinase/response regulator CckA
LADWLGYDLAEFEPGRMPLDDIVRGDGASLMMRGRADGEIRTEIIDLDLVRRNGTALPCACCTARRGLRMASWARRGRWCSTGAAACKQEEALRAVEVRFSRFFNDTPFAIATLDREGRIIRTNAPFSRMFGWSSNEHTLENEPMGNLLTGPSRSQVPRGRAAAIANKSEIEPVDRATGARGRPFGSALCFGVGGKSGFGRASCERLCARHDRAAQARGAVRAGQKMQAWASLPAAWRTTSTMCYTAIIGFSDLLLLKHQAGRSELCRPHVDQAERQPRRLG